MSWAPTKTSGSSQSGSCAAKKCALPSPNIEIQACAIRFEQQACSAKDNELAACNAHIGTCLSTTPWYMRKLRYVQPNNCNDTHLQCSVKPAEKDYLQETVHTSQYNSTRYVASQGPSIICNCPWDIVNISNVFVTVSLFRSKFILPSMLSLMTDKQNAIYMGC